MLNSIKDVQKKFDYLQKQQIKFLIKAESNISKIKRFRLNKTYSIKELSFKLGISTHTIKHLNNLNDQSDNYILKSESKLQLPELTVRHRTRDKDMMRLA